jgi:ferredoxin
MKCVQVTEVGSQVGFKMQVGDSLLKGMESAGARIVGIGCRGGGCGLCKIQILGGDFELGKMSSLHVSDSDRSLGYVLACRCFPKSDIAFKLIKKSIDFI